MRSRSVLVGLTVGLCWAALGLGFGGGHAAASVPPPDPTVPVATVVPQAGGTPAADNGLPPAQGPLVPVPAECVSPPPALAVFQGTIIDAVSTTARFRIDRTLAGDLSGYEIDHRVDVRYGLDTRFLRIGGEYLVGVGAGATPGVLVSTVRQSAPLFGGDAVVGVNQSDVACPVLDDPMRTLLVDGSSVDTGVLTPLHGAGTDLMMAIARPFIAAFAVLLGLVLLKQLMFAVGRSLRDLGDGVEPSSRRRRHRGDDTVETVDTVGW